MRPSKSKTGFVLGVGCLLLVCLAPACSSTQPPEATEATHLRILNQSSYTLEQVRVEVMEQVEDFGRVPPNEPTAYKPFEIAYRYAYVECVVEGQTLVLEPIDYVGETPLGPGFFTYLLTVDLQNERLALVLVEDG